MRFPPSFMDEIRARVSISSVVGRAVQWDRRKTNAAKGDYWACCPFHTEKSPSFHADDRKGRYHCFGCKESGDIFTFLTEREGVSFPEAVERLAREAGLALPEVSPEQEEREKRRATLYEVMELAASWYQERLQDAVGSAARGYLSDRGLSAQTCQDFGIGYAPDGRNVLKSFLVEKGVNSTQLVDSGLLVSGEDIAVPYDRFRDRIMFPIKDQRGRVVAFGGRAMRADIPAKYLNSPEGPLFHKGAVLYNFDTARQAAHKSGQLVVVEGYMDVIAMSRAGVAQAVAPLGTALTEDQLALLWRTVPEPVLCFDGDEAGLKAAWRAMDLALPRLQPGQSLRFVLLPDGQDPDDLLKNDGAEAVKQVLEAALPLSEMLWRRSLNESNLQTPEQKAHFESELETQIKTIDHHKVRSHYQADMADRLRNLWGRAVPGANKNRRFSSNLRMRTNARPLIQARRGRRHLAMPYDYQLPPSPELARSVVASTSRHGTGYRELAEIHLLFGLMNHPDLLDVFAEEMGALIFVTQELDSMRREILDIAALYPGLDSGALHDHLCNRGKTVVLERVKHEMVRNKLWFLETGAALQDVRTGFSQVVARHRKVVILESELKQAERKMAENPSEGALMHLNEIREQLQSTAQEAATIDGFGDASGRHGGQFL